MTIEQFHLYSGAFSEGYTIVKTMQVVTNSSQRTYRIEIRQVFRQQNSEKFLVSFYLREDVDLHGTYTKTTTASDVWILITEGSLVGIGAQTEEEAEKRGLNALATAVTSKKTP